jgi:hypothetical protein
VGTLGEPAVDVKNLDTVGSDEAGACALPILAIFEHVARAQAAMESILHPKWMKSRRFGDSM